MLRNTCRAFNNLHNPSLTYPNSLPRENRRAREWSLTARRQPDLGSTKTQSAPSNDRIWATSNTRPELVHSAASSDRAVWKTRTPTERRFPPSRGINQSSRDRPDTSHPDLGFASRFGQNPSRRHLLSPPLALVAPSHSPSVVACVAPSNPGVSDSAGVSDLV
ncbi:hypothetical protein U1Q18_040861 [Sarracenia purpurea var. burkii]